MYDPREDLVSAFAGMLADLEYDKNLDKHLAGLTEGVRIVSEVIAQQPSKEGNTIPWTNLQNQMLAMIERIKQKLAAAGDKL